MWFSYTWKAKEKCPCPHPSLLSSKISPQAGTPHQSRGTKAGLSISAPHSPLHMAQPHLGNPQGNLSEEIILPKNTNARSSLPSNQGGIYLHSRAGGI